MKLYRYELSAFIKKLEFKETDMIDFQAVEVLVRHQQYY